MHLFCLCSVQCRCPANTAMRHQSFITQSLLCCAITKPRRDTVREHAFNSASVGHNHGPCSVCRESEVCRTGLHSLTSHISERADTRRRDSNTKPALSGPWSWPNQHFTVNINTGSCRLNLQINKQQAPGWQRSVLMQRGMLGNRGSVPVGSEHWNADAKRLIWPTPAGSARFVDGDALQEHKSRENPLTASEKFTVRL